MSQRAQFAAIEEQLKKAAAEMGVRPEHLSNKEKAALLAKARQLLIEKTGYRPSKPLDNTARRR